MGEAKSLPLRFNLKSSHATKARCRSPHPGWEARLKYQLGHEVGGFHCKTYRSHWHRLCQNLHPCPREGRRAVHVRQINTDFNIHDTTCRADWCCRPHHFRERGLVVTHKLPFAVGRLTWILGCTYTHEFPSPVDYFFGSSSGYLVVCSAPALPMGRCSDYPVQYLFPASRLTSSFLIRPI